MLFPQQLLRTCVLLFAVSPTNWLLIYTFFCVCFCSLRYTISAGGDNYFAVRNGSNGAPIVSTTRKLDYEKNKQFSVVIEATDEKNICHKSRAVLLINVLDVNDNAPIFEKAKYQARVSEKAQKGTLVEKVIE